MGRGPRFPPLRGYRCVCNGQGLDNAFTAAVKVVNAKAEVARTQAALAINLSAARGLQDVLRNNLGPKGTMKM